MQGIRFFQLVNGMSSIMNMMAMSSRGGTPNAPTFRAVHGDTEVDGGMPTPLPRFCPAKPAVVAYRPTSARTDIAGFESRLVNLQRKMTSAGLPPPAYTKVAGGSTTLPPRLGAIGRQATTKTIIQTTHEAKKVQYFGASKVAEFVANTGEPCPPQRTAFLMSAYDGDHDGRLDSYELEIMLQDLKATSRVHRELRCARHSRQLALCFRNLLDHGCAMLTPSALLSPRRYAWRVVATAAAAASAQASASAAVSAPAASAASESAEAKASTSRRPPPLPPPPGAPPPPGSPRAVLASGRPSGNVRNSDLGLPPARPLPPVTQCATQLAASEATSTSTSTSTSAVHSAPPPPMTAPPATIQAAGRVVPLLSVTPATQLPPSGSGGMGGGMGGGRGGGRVGDMSGSQHAPPTAPAVSLSDPLTTPRSTYAAAMTTAEEAAEALAHAEKAKELRKHIRDLLLVKAQRVIDTFNEMVPIAP